MSRSAVTFSFSKIAILVAGIVMVWVSMNTKPWNVQRVIQHDVNSYYAYLPAAFIYRDLTFEFTRNLPKDFNGQIWVHQSGKGGLVSKMPMGCAVMYLPFFLIAHAIAVATLDAPTGYDTIYHGGIALAALIYSLLGALILRRTLLRFTSEIATTITLLAVLLATNLFYYTVVEPGMSHAYSFFLFASFLELSLRWTKSRSNGVFITMAVLLGLIILVRPTNGIIVLLPLVLSFSGGKAKSTTQWLKGHFQLVILGAWISMSIVFLQLIYWKYATNEWIYYSYRDEGFFFNNPQLWKGLFSFRKGFFIYTPIMVFAIVGLFQLRKKASSLFMGIALVFAAHVYISFSWWCWWYGGGFGARSMIELYPLLALPLGLFIQKLVDSARWKTVLVSVAVFLFLALNMLQTYQYRVALLHWDAMTAKAYFAIFGRIDYPSNYAELIDPPDYEAAMQGKSE